MRKSAVLVILAIILLSCSDGDVLRKINDPNANTIVKIERQQKWYTNPSIRITCKKTTLNYEKRILTIEGLMSVAGGGRYADDEWLVEKMEILNNKLIIYIPADANYKIHIGPQLHLLHKLASK